MNFDYINEAFKKLELLNEETFDTSLDGINKLDNFMDQDSSEEIVDIIDPVATTEDEIEDSYIGKVITNCNVCHSHIFENKEDIVINEEGIVNSDKECPYCGETSGFVIVGEIKPYQETSTEDTTDDVSVSVDGEEVDVETSQTQDDELSESLGIGAGLALGGAAIGAGIAGSALLDDLKDETAIDDTEELEEASATLTRTKPDVTEVKGTVADVLLSNSDLIDACGSNEAAVKKTITNILTSADVRDRETADEAIRIISKCNGAKLWSTIGTYMSGLKVTPVGRFAKRRLDASLEEDVNNVNVETDDSIVMVHSEENGKVTVSTEPKEPEINQDEVIGEISDETMSEIESNNNIIEDELADDETSEEDVDFDIEEVDEEGFDELGESYLKNVYDNVKSFKTTSVHGDDSRIVLEGLITFNSGVSKNTGFVFTADSATSDGVVRFVGMNEHLTTHDRAFTLKGSIKEKKLLPESLSYNYHVKTSDGKYSKVSGTVSKE